MALIAPRDFSGGRDLMRIRQREARGGVIERRIRPCDRVMTLRTKRGGETCGNVIRHVSAKRWRAVPRGLVAPEAIGVC